MNRYVRRWGAICVYVLSAGPIALAGLWLGAGLAWSAWATVMTATAALGAVLGLYLLLLKRSRWAPLVALALVLIGCKILVDLGYSEVSNRRGSQRPACARIRAGVPPGEQLYLYGELPKSVLFYLDPASSGLRSALESRGHAFACAQLSKRRGAVEPLPGVRSTELDRAQYDRDELILLRLDTQQPSGVPK